MNGLVDTDFAAYCVIAIAIAGFVLGYHSRDKYRKGCNECHLADVREATAQAVAEHDGMHNRYGRCHDDNCPRNR